MGSTSSLADGFEGERNDIFIGFERGEDGLYCWEGCEGIRLTLYPPFIEAEDLLGGGAPLA